MVHDEGVKQTLLRIEKNCKLLYEGYPEKVDYYLEISYHRESCQWYGKSTTPKVDCECPVVVEARTKHVNRPGLLRQLEQFARNKDTDRNPKAERGAPRIKVAGRPPGDMGGFFTLDEIMCDIPSVIDRVLEEVGRDRTWASQPVKAILMGLTGQVMHFAEARPDQARVVDKATGKWVKQAQDALRITVGDAVFDSVVCGNCGGGLSTPWGNRGDHEVRCIGSPTDPPCGHTYPMGEWIKLYEDHKRGRS